MKEAEECTPGETAEVEDGEEEERRDEGEDRRERKGGSNDVSGTSGGGVRGRLWRASVGREQAGHVY